MWMLVLVLPWFVAIFWRAGDTFFADSIGGDMLSKLAAQESHGAPPGLYLLLFWITFWPGAALAGMAAPAGWGGGRRAGGPGPFLGGGSPPRGLSAAGCGKAP